MPSSCSLSSGITSASTVSLVASHYNTPLNDFRRVLCRELLWPEEAQAPLDIYRESICCCSWRTRRRKAQGQRNMAIALLLGLPAHAMQDYIY